MTVLLKYSKLNNNFGYQTPKNSRQAEYYDAFKEEYAHALKFNVNSQIGMTRNTECVEDGSKFSYDIKGAIVTGHFNQMYQDGSQIGAGQAGQDGQGITGAISGALSTIKMAKEAYQYYGSERATKFKNLYGKYINKNPNWRPSYAGERHLIDPYSGTMHNYSGPGTQTKKRLTRGDPPVDGFNGLDAQSMRHDIAYMNAQNFGSIRRADKKYIQDVKKSSAGPISKAIAIAAISSKMKAEDLGLLKKKASMSLNENAIQENPVSFGSGDPMASLRKKTYKKSKKNRVNKKVAKAIKDAIKRGKQKF